MNKSKTTPGKSRPPRAAVSPHLEKAPLRAPDAPPAKPSPKATDDRPTSHPETARPSFALP